MINTEAYAIANGILVKNFQDNYSPPYKYSNPTTNRIRRVLTSSSELQNIVDHFEDDAKFYPVGVQGLPSNTMVGSNRVITYDENFAKYLTMKLADHLRPMYLSQYSRVDWISDNPEELNYWIPIGVSPVFRYMKYAPNSPGHYTHYDAPFKNPDNPLIRTLRSGVLYLTTNNCDTRFVYDKQGDIPFVDRDHSDWTRPAASIETYSSIKSEAGDCALFDHQVAHDVSPNDDPNVRIIIRFDIIYQAIGRM
jgi:hypothetical protein